MKAINIIDALTRMGNTEGTGICETPSDKTDITNFLINWFGGGCEVSYEGEIKTDTKYLYSYSEKLWNIKNGICKEDAMVKLEVQTAEDNEHLHTETEIVYLYEIEK